MGRIIPYIMANKKCLKPPTSINIWLKIGGCLGLPRQNTFTRTEEVIATSPATRHWVSQRKEMRNDTSRQPFRKKTRPRGRTKFQKMIGCKISPSKGSIPPISTYLVHCSPKTHCAFPARTRGQWSFRQLEGHLGQIWGG